MEVEEVDGWKLPLLSRSRLGPRLPRPCPKLQSHSGRQEDVMFHPLGTLCDAPRLCGAHALMQHDASPRNPKKSF